MKLQGSGAHGPLQGWASENVPSAGVGGGRRGWLLSLRPEECPLWCPGYPSLIANGSQQLVQVPVFDCPPASACLLFELIFSSVLETSGEPVRLPVFLSCPRSFPQPRPGCVVRRVSVAGQGLVGAAWTFQ